MHKFFVCEEGPMGGVNIVAVAASREDATRMAVERAAKYHKDSDPLFVYEQVAEIAQRPAAAVMASMEAAAKLR